MMINLYYYVILLPHIFISTKFINTINLKYLDIQTIFFTRDRERVKKMEVMEDRSSMDIARK